MRRKAYCLIVFLFAAGILYSKEMPLSEYLSAVSEKNPRIISAGKAYEGADFAIRYSYALKNPTIEFERMYTGDMNEKSFYLKQEIENPARLRRLYGASKAFYEIKKLEYEKTKNDIVTEAEISYYDYLYISRKKDIYRDILSALDLLIENLKASYSAGSIRLKDISALELKRMEVKNEISLMENEEDIYRKKLMSFADNYTPLELSKKIDEQVSLSISFEEMKSVLKEKNLSVLAKKKEIEISEFEYGVSKTSYYPDFMFGYRKRYQNSNSYDLMLGFSLPVFANKNSSRIKEKEKMLESARKEFENILLEEEFKAEKYFLLAKANMNSSDYYRSAVIPAASLNLDLNIAAYNAGSVSIKDVIYSIDEKLKIELKYYEYIIEFHKAKAGLNGALGRSL